MDVASTSPSRGRTALAATLAGLLALVGGTTARAAHTEPGNVCPAPEGNASFPDVEDGDTFAATIECMAGYGIASGYPDGEYKPERSIPRGQMAQFAFDMIETARPGTLDPDAPNPFDDVDEGGQFEPAISALADAGVVDGHTATAFLPTRSVSRGAMAKFAHNAIMAVTGHSLVDAENRDPTTNGNPDVDRFLDDEDSVFEPHIDAIAAEDIVSGTSATTYEPARTVTRGAVSQFLMASAAYLDSVGQWEPTAGDGGGGGSQAPLVVNTDTGESFPDIQAAVDDADTDGGDTLQVFGDHHGSVSVHKGVTLQSTDATLHGSLGVSSGGVTIDGLTIRDLDSFGGVAFAIAVADGVEDVTVTGNTLDGTGLDVPSIGLVTEMGATSGTVEGNAIRNLDTGVLLQGEASFTVTDNDFTVADPDGKVYVDDEAGALDLAAVLQANRFDPAATVDEAERQIVPAP